MARRRHNTKTAALKTVGEEQFDENDDLIDEIEFHGPPDYVTRTNLFIEETVKRDSAGALRASITLKPFSYLLIPALILVCGYIAFIAGSGSAPLNDNISTGVLLIAVSLIVYVLLLVMGIANTVIRDKDAYEEAERRYWKSKGR